MEPAVIYIKAPISEPAKERKQDSDAEPPKKKFMDGKELVNKHEAIKGMLGNFTKVVTQRFENIESKIDLLDENYDELEKKVNNLSSAISQQSTTRATVADRDQMFYEVGVRPVVPFSSKVTFIALNRKEDYPEGTWLGDPNSQECRVRCPISLANLFHIHSMCTTPEKMALSLLDYLFDRETLACSNVSGTGKHKKKQLDPLFIYGIKCHLITHFGITEQLWHKIKQNIDSKCRAAFKKKVHGLPLNIQSANLRHTRKEDIYNQLPSSPEIVISENSLLHGRLTEPDAQNEGLTFEMIGDESETNILERAISEAKGNFEILHATPEEIASIQEGHPVSL